MNLNEINIEREKKVIFMGTPEFSVPVLENLIKHYNVRAIITQPDRPVGRKGELSMPPVKKVGIEHNILVFQPEKVGTMVEEIKAFSPDFIITCAYGQIIPKSILEIPKYGCINVHASLLPKLRGGAPIHKAIINGFKKTGVTIMYMNEKMDEGDIITQVETIIADSDTTEKLHDRLSLLGKDLLIETLPSIFAGQNPRIAQNHAEATYGYNISREDEQIDFHKTRREIFNQVRGLNSWPVAYTMLDDKRIKVWEVEIGCENHSKLISGSIINLYKDGIGVKANDGEIILKVIQPEGKGKMSVSSYLNGLKNKEELLNKILR